MTKMLKLLFVFSFVAIASSAEAKVCFLPGVLAGDGCFDNTAYVNNPCPGFTRTNPCPSGYAQETCVNGSQTLYKCTCQSGNFTRDNGLGTTYTCTKNYDPSCGCSPQDTECNKSTFKLAQEDGYCQIKFPGSEPSETCTNPSDGKIFYKDCECSSSVYPYTCKEAGLKEPTGSNYCVDKSGNKHYSRCDCADNWQSNPCTERTDGCTAVSKRVLKGDNEYCYSCTAEKCAKAGEINLDNYWCAMPQGSQTDCAKLGYTYAPDGLCPDGTTGVKCLYNKQYMYCLTSGSCDTSTDANCASWSSTGTDCTCTKCNNGYELKNGKCEQKISCATGTYKTAAECKAANPSAVSCVDLNSVGCYTPIFKIEPICPIGSYTTQEECQKAGNGFLQLCTEDSNGCWSPATSTKSCSSYTLSKCPANGVCSACPSDKSKFKLTGCNTNYYLNNDECISCATAKVDKEKLKKRATNSLLNCCSDTFNLCRKSRDCDGSGNYGSWNDGCMLAYTQMIAEPSERDNKTTIFEATQKACIKTLQNVVDDIESFNEKCPNHTVKASDISPTQQCRDVSDNGHRARAAYDYGDRGVGCFNSTI